MKIFFKFNSLGGASEALVSRNNEDNLILKERKGFIKLALKNGLKLYFKYEININFN